MRSKAKPFPFWATIFTVLSAIILCSLGTWQIVRLNWKQNLIGSLAKEYSKNAEEYPLTIADFDALEKNHVKRGVISGALNKDKVIFLHNGRQSYDVYAPLKMTEGSVLVKLGWTAQKENIKLPNKVTVTGTAKLKSNPWRFGIKNVPEQGQWVYLDLDDVRSYTAASELSQAVFYAETIQPTIGNITTEQERYKPSNNHMKYIFFWFSMCGVLLVIYQKRFWN